MTFYGTRNSIHETEKKGIIREKLGIPGFGAPLGLWNHGLGLWNHGLGLWNHGLGMFRKR